MTNTGAIAGIGRVTNPITNTGVIQASGGKLTFSAVGIVNNAGAPNPGDQRQHRVVHSGVNQRRCHRPQRRHAGHR